MIERPVADWDAELDRLSPRPAPTAPSRRPAAEQPLGDRRARCATTPSVRRASCPADAAPPSPAARFGTRSTPGSRRGSASRTSSTPTTCPAAATPASTTTTDLAS
jgi:hypothetical protein